ncbi:unnamed protein product [Linum tenue]|uniref:Uncharacterized protein n=1 Tax=Linum tenue TaxID=586396 RepID=A0AAV0IDB4_9ROSI|nr:unnamed protein product [Linum tenue]
MGKAKQAVDYFVVDAFTDSPFKGNPAAVCLLEEERDEAWLQSLAAEFNDNASHTLFTNGFVDSDTIEFETLSGILTAKRVPAAAAAASSPLSDGEAKDSFLIELNFPTVPTTEFNYAATAVDDDIATISKALRGVSIVDMRRTTTAEDLFLVLPSGEAVLGLEPNFGEIVKCPGRGIIVSGAAPSGSGFDFYSRFFCPKYGINEDPVCGSAHCALAPYWSKKLGKSDFLAYAASPRSGVLNIHLDEVNERVMLRGKAVTVMQGSVLV